MSPDRELFDAWLGRAADDLRIARIVLGQDPPMYWAAVYHAQQAAEKALKGAIAGGGTPPPHTHDLAALLLAARATADMPELDTDVARLNEYSVGPRYPDVAERYSREEADRAVESAERILSTVRGSGDES